MQKKITAVLLSLLMGAQMLPLAASALEQPEDAKEQTGAVYAEAALAEGHVHDFTDGYTDNGDGTHSGKCGCGEVSGEKTAHTFVKHVCVCGAKEIVSDSVEMPFDKEKISGWSYRNENEYFVETATEAYTNNNFGASVGGMGDDEYYLTVEAKDPSVIITGVDAKVTFLPQNYAYVSISGGTKRESTVPDDGIVHIDGIGESSFSFGAGTEITYISDITVYFAYVPHDFSGAYQDNGDGTHSVECTECGEYGAAEAHGYESHVCPDCGAKELVIKCAGMPFDKAKISGWSYRNENEYFIETATEAYTNNNFGACVGGMGADEYYLTVEAKDASVNIIRVEAKVTFLPQNYASVGISGGVRRESTVPDDGIVHIDRINDSSFSFGAGTEITYISDITVYFTDGTIAHDFNASYTDNGDGTHAGVCECGEESSERIAHTFGTDGLCTFCGAQPGPTVLKLSSIRVSGTPGLRFAAYVTNEQREASSSYGFLAARENAVLKDDPTKLVFDGTNSASGTNGFGITYTSGEAYNRANGIDKVYAEDGGAFGLTGVEAAFFTGVMQGIPEAYYAENLVARPYMVIGGVTLYGETCAKSLYTNALAIRDGGYAGLDEDGIKYINSIISAVDSEVDIDVGGLLK